MTNSELINIAKSTLRSVLDNPYDSECPTFVVAVLLGKSGKVYTGVNVHWWHSSCAEQVAIGSAFASGERKFDRIVSVSRGADGKINVVTPCGICRQMFAIHAPNIKVIIKDGNRTVTKSVDDLLPYCYRGEY